MTRALAILAALAATAQAGPSHTRAAGRAHRARPHAGPAKGHVKPASRVSRAAAKRAEERLAHRLDRDPSLDGAHARVSIGEAGGMRAPSEVVGRRAEPLTPAEETAKEIEKLLRGPLRHGVTGMFVADARTGDPLFAVNADDRLNPASNVKMISTATALELLGPGFRYTTRVLGPAPDAAGTIHGDVYLLGTWDPTLTASDFDELAAQLADRGVHALDGDVLVGSDPTRDGIYRAVVPIHVKAGAPGKPATATTPEGFDLVSLELTAKTARHSRRSHLTFAATPGPDAAGHPHVVLAIGGTIGRGRSLTYSLATTQRTADAAYTLRAALRAHQIAVQGDVRVEELGDYVGDAVTAGYLPGELARHQSAQLADIVRHVNKWSINWLADRVIMTATALTRRTTPSMDGALAEMYAWLARHPHLGKDDLLVDTGSGLSYHTRISTHELVSVLRSAAGFAQGSDPATARAWLASLSIAGTDGTLRHRFRSSEIRGHIHGKTGTLSTVIALSGLLDIDPDHPVIFSIVTNGDHPLHKRLVRRTHEKLVGLLCKYLEEREKTDADAVATHAPAAPAPAHAAAVPPAAAARRAPPPPHATLHPRSVSTAGGRPAMSEADAAALASALSDDPEDHPADPALDAETAGKAAAAPAAGPTPRTPAPRPARSRPAARP